MKVVEVKYGRKFNLGNYESEDIGLTAALDEDDNAVDIIAELKRVVAESQQGAAPAEEPAKEKSAKAAAKAAKAKPVAEEEEVTEEEETVDEDSDEAEEEEEKTKAKSKPAKVKKGTVYARGNEIHKATFAEHLAKVAPKWKATDESKAKAKKLSVGMEGKPFLDADGEIEDSFLKALKAGMK